MESPLSPAAYRVLARAYRPTRLSALIGQDALVRTLKNAFASGRIAHAFLLSGIRGVGKTTTARIIARGLNCTGPDGQGGPTPEPCGVCPSCVAIDEDRAVDVIEMDAASQTGKEDVRELLEGLQFLPGFSRYKVYILDEVHMLSGSAWNALLKTVEEPPPHAKFIFATTEIRKVPVTVLSRCQKFELRRVEPEELAAHLAEVCAKEGIEAAPEALGVIARVAEGSVRDALSLLDQAIATADGPLDAALIQAMLGLSDRVQLLDLFDAVVQGDARGSLERFADLYARGADPVAVAQDLLEIGHWLSRLKVAPEATSSLGVGAAAAERASAMARALNLPVLARAWQMLLRGIDEIRIAPDARAAAEMLLLRLASVADLPSPADLARLARGEAGGMATVPLRRMTPAAPGPSPAPSVHRSATPLATAPRPEPAEPVAVAAPVPARAEPADFPTFVARLRDGGEAPLAAWLQQSAHLIRFEPGRLELRFDAGVPADVAGRVGEAAARVLGRRWVVVLVAAQGEATLAEQSAAAKHARMAELAQDPVLLEVLAAFPGAQLVDIRRRAD
ncbi:MAG: DNA polymerase III subunit gamma/tau [Geminicoccaceae bacterium]